jgi:outer membrane protein TolC
MRGDFMAKEHMSPRRAKLSTTLRCTTSTTALVLAGSILTVVGLLATVLLTGSELAYAQETPSPPPAASDLASNSDPDQIPGLDSESNQSMDQNLNRIGSVQDDTLFVSLPQIITAALERNEMLAASSSLSDAASAEALGAWRGFLPRIQIGEFFVRSNNALDAFAFKLNKRAVDPLNDFTPDAINNPPTAEQFNTRFMVMQPIFNGLMGLNGKRAADKAAQAAQFNHKRAEETVVFQAIQSYQGLALAKAFEKVMLVAVTSAEGHVKQAKAMVEAEMATAADLLQAEVFLSNLQQQLIETRNMMAVAGENIKLLTAIHTQIPLAPALMLSDQQLDSLPAELDLTAIIQRPDLQAHKLRTEAAGKMVNVAWGAVIPHINLSVQKDLFGERIFSDDADSWRLGIFGTWDIFSGLENVGNIKKAKAEKRAAEYMYDFETRQARVQATQAWLEAKAALEKVNVSRDAVAAAQEGLRIVSNQYREGLASMIDLLDTQAAATRAEGNLVQALHDYQVGLARLEYAGAREYPVQN